MNRGTLQFKRCAAVVKHLMVLAVIVTGVATVTPVYAFDEGAESIDVTCYKKVDGGSLSIGNVSVTKADTAAVSCNATYIDCKDTCVGCFYDQKLSETVCYNEAGEKVVQ